MWFENEIKNDLNLDELFEHKRYVLPDHKTGKILSSIELNESLEILRNLLKSGPVFVHCYAAVERSPLVCMAWLMKEHHLTLQQSLDYLMQTNPGTNPLPDQLRGKILKVNSTFITSIRLIKLPVPTNFYHFL